MGSYGVWLYRTRCCHVASTAGQPQPACLPHCSGASDHQPHGIQQPRSGSGSSVFAEVAGTKPLASPPRGNEPGEIQDHPAGKKQAEDYANSFRVLRPLLDFFVVNVSSPNTPNLRQLQDKSALRDIFSALNQVQSGLPASEQRPYPGEGGTRPHVSRRSTTLSNCWAAVGWQELWQPTRLLRGHRALIQRFQAKIRGDGWG